MNYDSLTHEQIQTALSFCDYEDQETWVMCGMAVKSELGESGKQIWLDWSMLGSTYNQKQALNRWKSFKLNGGTRIGSLIHEAKKWGFKFDANQNKVSKHVVEQRKIQRLEIEKQAEKEIQDQKKLQALKAIEAQAIWRKTKPCDSHPYLMRKDVLAHGLRLNDKGDLVVPLYAYGKIVSVQTINADGEKKYMYGAQKSGVYNVIGSVTDSILICEGWATGATLHEATQLCVFVSLDSGNLPNVAAVVRKMHPLSKIIICADNDQYKKVNTGLKAADKAACKADADVVYPIFKDVSTKPTDFNDLYILEGYSPIIDAILPLTKRQYKPRQRNAPVFDAFKLSFIEGSSEKLETSSDPLTVACAAMTVGMKLSEGVPAFNTVEQIRKFLDHPLIHYKTHTSIMCRILWSIQNRKRRAMTAIKPQSWKKHNQGYFLTLDNERIEVGVGKFIPAHYGRRCTFIQEMGLNRFERCDHFWDCKVCETCGIDNDIAARRCSGCKALLIDPNDKLVGSFLDYKNDLSMMQTDRVINLYRKEAVSAKNNPMLKVTFVTPHRRFMAFFSNRVNRKFYEMLKDTSFNPITVSYKKKDEFFTVYDFNRQEDLPA